MNPAESQAGAVTNFPCVGRWILTSLPAGWLVIAGFGIKQMTADPRSIAANVALGEDRLSSANGMLDYIETQKTLIGKHLVDTRIAGPQATQFAAAEEAHLVLVRHHTERAGDMLHAQTYVRQGSWVGIVTLTTREAELRSVRAPYDEFVRGLRIAAEPASSAMQAGEGA